MTILLTIWGCKKQDEWLDKKSNKADVIPNTLQDFQAILDNTGVMNTSFPAIGMISTDNTVVTDATVQAALNTSERNALKWSPDIYEGETTGVSDWVNPYRMIEYANVVLEGIQKIEQTPQNVADYNNVKGSAHFFRGLGFYLIASLYAKPYVKATATSDLGIPIKLSGDVNEKVGRSTIQQTYERITADLSEAVKLLPATSLFKTRPNRASAFGFLAKAYLSMGEYGLCLSAVEESLKLNNTLLNLNTISSTPTYPFPTYQAGNAEIKFYALTISYNVATLSNMLIDPALYNSYSANDLRRTLFYRTNTDGTRNFRGRYSGAAQNFSGLANNELYLIKAECQVRGGQIADGMVTLNALLTTRFVTNTYQPYSSSNETDALMIILSERRKELPFTGNLRWEDLRRLNQDSRFAKTMSKTIGSQTYTLPANDPRYTFPIIPIEIILNGFTQNQR
jgi:starch-binding outer membrane protein, SusD/RagB family